MMTKKHEELVEKIRLVWCKDCGDGPSRYEYSPDLDDDACEGGVVTIKLCRERARECVAHILSAFRDGRLKIPGEKWRGWGRFRMGDEVPYFMRGYLGVVEIDSQIKPPPGLEYTIIALSGTGKEEKLPKEITKGQRP